MLPSFYRRLNRLNNAQRGHYNFIESVWGAMGLLLVGGLFHPVVFAGLGAGYIVGRVIYAIGYMSASGVYWELSIHRRFSAHARHPVSDC